VTWKITSKKEDAVIEFGSYKLDNQLVYYIRDNGAGFDSTFFNKLFEPFIRMHLEKGFEGTGIGLSIGKRIISHHGGMVRAEGDPGKGAALYFTLG